jgi:hypothetical protein
MDKDLLDVAQLLATAAQQTSPRQALLRRAVSTAYYAVFQTLAAQCAATLVTYSGSDWETYTIAYRALDHAVAQRLLGARDIGTSFGDEIAALGAAFVRLNQARTQADYIPGTFPLGKSQVAELIEQARGACQIVEAIPTPIMRRLAAQLLLKRR